MSEQGDDTLYQVVVNEKEQYSIWPADRDPPEGWKPAGKQGTKDECLDYVREAWSDMRPRPLRGTMGGAGDA